MVFRALVGLVSFLTIMPVSNKKTSPSICLESISRHMHFFPLVGTIIAITCIPVAVPAFYFTDRLVSGIVITVFLVIITGAHHTDALADFADGIMAKGNVERKQKAMRDPAIGSAGAVAIFSYMIGMTVAISSFAEIEMLIVSLVMSETMAKYAMVLQAFFSRSAWEGYSTPFTKNMKSNSKITISTIMALVLMMLTWQGIQPLLRVVATGMACCFVITYVANKSFGGVTGDVMGATNEIVRLCCMISIAT